MTRDNRSILPTPTAAADSTAPPDAERGVTQINDRVVEKIAARLANEVEGVVDRATGGVRGMLPGSSTSSTTADADVGARSARIALALDLRYPISVSDTVEQVRSHVIDGVQRLVGLSTTEVDVTVKALVGGRPAKRRVE